MKRSQQQQQSKVVDGVVDCTSGGIAFDNDEPSAKMRRLYSHIAGQALEFAQPTVAVAPTVTPTADRDMQSSAKLKRLNDWLLTDQAEGKQPPYVYFIGIQTIKHLARVLPKIAYADRSSFLSDPASLGDHCSVIQKDKETNIRIYYEAFLFDHELQYTTNIQTEKLKVKSIDEINAWTPGAQERADPTFECMVQVVKLFRASRTTTSTTSHVVAFVADQQNDWIAQPQHIHVAHLNKQNRKFFFKFHISNILMIDAHSDTQVWQSKMCIMKKANMAYVAPNKAPIYLSPGSVTVLPPTPEPHEKRLAIESFFLEANAEKWRSFVHTNTQTALYFELLFNPETVVTYAINYFYHKTICGDSEGLFDLYFGSQQNRGWVYSDPACVEWLLTCLDLDKTDLVGPDDDSFGWTPRTDDDSDRFNVTNRVAFDNTAAWPDNCTNHAIAPEAQGLHHDTDLNRIYVIATESHQLDAFLGRPTQDPREPGVWTPNKHVPANTLTQACCNFVDKFYGRVLTGINGVPESKDQLGKFFNRGTDFSVLTKCRELMHVKVPVLFNKEGAYAYVMVKVKLDAVLGKAAYVAGNVHNKTLSASYTAALCKAAAELYPREMLKTALGNLFTKCYCFCQSLTKRMVPISYGREVDELIRTRDDISNIIVALGPLPGECKHPRVDPMYKPPSMGPPREHPGAEPVSWDMLDYHGPTSQVYSTYNANLVSDKTKAKVKSKRGGTSGVAGGGAGEENSCAGSASADTSTGLCGCGKPIAHSPLERPPSLCTLLFSRTHIYYWCRNPSGNDAKVLGTKSLMTVVYLMPDNQEDTKNTMPNIFTAEFMRPNGNVDTLCAYGHTYFSTRTLNHKVGTLPNLDGITINGTTVEIPLFYEIPKEAIARFNQFLYNKPSQDPPVVYFAQFSTSNNHHNYSPSRALRLKRKEESLIRPKSTHTNSPTTFFCFMNVIREGYISLSKLHNGHASQVYQSLYGIKNLTKKYNKPERELRMSVHENHTLDNLTGSEKLLKNIIWSMYKIIPGFRRHIDDSQLFKVSLFINKTGSGEEIKISKLEKMLQSITSAYNHLKQEHERTVVALEHQLRTVKSEQQRPPSATHEDELGAEHAVVTAAGGRLHHKAHGRGAEHGRGHPPADAPGAPAAAARTGGRHPPHRTGAATGVD
ncbi:protein ORF87 [Cyprinid herpesvirus 3]|nr:protein ORF87 [Cyprinid herpesvirus 3]AOO32808.1 protein ORF87 [Cyprinid herpesvirus 3]AOO32965.1 protein ORF87 [Cyprinid herpesvirus 3]AOO33435.1 protein ORF87 [Cyprinid herpesvirus 3]